MNSGNRCDAERRELTAALNSLKLFGRSDWSVDSFGVANAEGLGYMSWYVAVYIMEDMVKACPESRSASLGDPTIEECVAAINRNEHRKDSTWEASAVSQTTHSRLNETEVRALGAYYLDRERAAEKGGE